MSKLEDHVTSLELSQRLSNLGVMQKSIFQWIMSPNEEKWMIYSAHSKMLQFGYSAFLASELGEILPSCIGNPHFEIVKLENTNQWGIEYICSDYHSGWHLKLCDAFAHMLIHLIKNNLLNEKWKAKWLEVEE